MRRDKEYWNNCTRAAYASRRETNEVDFKVALSDNTERLKEHINAFGNSDDGGLFVFGVSNSYQSEPDFSSQQETIAKTIANLARDSQVPALSIESFMVQLSNHEHLCLYVHPGNERPVFIKDRSPLGGDACFKRSGASTLPMPITEIRERLARSKNVYYDESPIEDRKLSELDFQKIEQVLNDFRATEGESLRNIGVLLDNHVLTGNPRHFSITLAGWLVFAKDPQSQRSLRNAHIEFQHFRTSTREEAIKKAVITGPISSQVEQAIDLLLQHLWVMPNIQGTRRVEIPSYDRIMLREVIANCVVHRDYSKMHQPVKIALFKDRLEIENPGGLMPGLTSLNLIHKREWRNPSLAQLLEKFRIGDMDGQGIDRLYSATRRIKLPAPQFFDNQTSFKVVLSGPKTFDNFTPEEKRLTVLVMLILEATIDNEALRNAFDIDIMKASTLIKSLVDEKVIRPTTASRKYARYQMTEEYQQKIFG